MSKALHELTIHEALTGMRQGDFSAVDLTQALLERIALLDGQVKAYLTVTAELALEQAAQADALAQQQRPDERPVDQNSGREYHRHYDSGPRGPLSGRVHRQPD